MPGYRSEGSNHLSPQAYVGTGHVRSAVMSLITKVSETCTIGCACCFLLLASPLHDQSHISFLPRSRPSSFRMYTVRGRVILVARFRSRICIASRTGCCLLDSERLWRSPHANTSIVNAVCQVSAISGASAKNPSGKGDMGTRATIRAPFAVSTVSTSYRCRGSTARTLKHL